MIEFSVLICTYNRHEWLRRALRALVEKTNEKPDQIVVVNGGDEKADRVVESFIGQSGMDILLVKTVNRNLAASRNIGLPRCQGKIVALTDDDAEVFPDWVAQIKRVHAEHPEAGAVGGLILAGGENSIISLVSDLITFPSPEEPGYVRTVSGVNCSYKRELVEKVGCQDESLFRGEDVDYNWRIKKLGYEVYFDPSIKVYHYHRADWGSLLHQHYMYGRAYYLVRGKWTDMHSIYPHGLKRFKDFLKAIYFVVGIFYEPLWMARKLKRWGDRFRAIPIIFSAGVVWRAGMIVQAVRECISLIRIT